MLTSFEIPPWVHDHGQYKCCIDMSYRGLLMNGALSGHSNKFFLQMKIPVVASPTYFLGTSLALVETFYMFAIPSCLI